MFFDAVQFLVFIIIVAMYGGHGILNTDAKRNVDALLIVSYFTDCINALLKDCDIVNAYLIQTYLQ